MAAARIKGVLSPVVTPFKRDLSPDTGRFIAHCKWLLSQDCGLAVFGTNSFYTDQVIEDAQAGDQFEFRARFPMNLGVGTYSFSVALSSTETHLVNNYEWRDLALVFTVANTQRSTFVGMSWVPPQITITASGRDGSAGMALSGINQKLGVLEGHD